jgi:hypothetical protein
MTTMLVPTTEPIWKKSIRFGTFNIQSCRNGRVEQVLGAIGQMGVDWGILTEAKLTRSIHTRFSSDYHVFATEATSSSQGGLALFYPDLDAFQVEAVKRHGPNVLSFKLVTAGIRHPVFEVYIPPSDTDLHTLEYLLQALDSVEIGLEPIVMGDLNADLDSPKTEWVADIATEILLCGLVDMLSQFKKRRRDVTYMWRQQRGPDNLLIKSRCDYILGTDRRRFTKVAIQPEQVRFPRTPATSAKSTEMIMGTFHRSGPTMMNSCSTLKTCIVRRKLLKMQNLSS